MKNGKFTCWIYRNVQRKIIYYKNELHQKKNVVNQMFVFYIPIKSIAVENIKYFEEIIIILENAKF